MPEAVCRAGYSWYYMANELISLVNHAGRDHVHYGSKGIRQPDPMGEIGRKFLMERYIFVDY